MNKKNNDFFFEHYEKNAVPSIFKEIFYIQEKNNFVNHNYNLEENLSVLNSVMFVPSYTIPKVDETIFNTKKVKHFFKGYAIELEDFNSVDDYLKFRFRKNSKSILKKVKRLEHCFHISYHFYFGKISKKDYNFFMSQLKEMIAKRFQQRGDVSQNLLNWEHYHKIFFNLINDKKASLFVIKNNDEPICISISNHFNGKMFSSVSSYNIDYGKFSLGNTEIYKKLEWCLKNNHNTYEMGMGDLSYKQEWSSNIYNFEHQIVYPKKSYFISLMAHLEFIKIYLKEAVYKLAYVRYKNFKSRFKKVNCFDEDYKIIENTTEDFKNVSKIDYNARENQYLRKAIFDFLYSNIEQEKDITVNQISKLEKTFIINGKFNSQTIQFN
ncbi:GNAT family N-acetyltransferase [Gaetbulibacter aquiaggeris]|uniref:GNAT family N-acetyltransferase n=1 Tax=Gaetbulibacter aquiaggeris TaxID=1735373 RepID=A0ABW7MRK2_9FLAO